MAVSIILGPYYFGVYVRAPNCWKLPDRGLRFSCLSLACQTAPVRHKTGELTKEVGIQNFRVQALKAPKANFKVILSQTDLWKITKMKMRRITMFKDLGVWVPRFRWTSEFDETAREGWQQHVASSSEEDNLIQYKDSFEEEVQKYDAGDTYHVGGKDIPRPFLKGILNFCWLYLHTLTNQNPLFCRVPINSI